MLKNIFSDLKHGFILFILLSIITGVIYPLFITGCAQLFFPWTSNGSMIIQSGRVIGSAPIGQYFDDPKYFWGRPSATTPFPYNAESSLGSNLGPSNPIYLSLISDRIKNLKNSNPEAVGPIPMDLITASASGLDPDISPLAAFYQVPRVAKVRNIAETDLVNLINNLTKKRPFFILGEPRIHVLELNLELDNLGNFP